MDEYSQRGTGEQRPPGRRPPQKKPDNRGWYSWPIIIVLFALGLWPVALILMFINIFGDEKRKKQPASQRKPSAEERMESAVENAVERAKAKVNIQVTSSGEKKEEKNGKKAKSGKKSKKQEVKAPGKAPRPLQEARHRLLRRLGFTVYVLDDESKIGGILDEICTT